MNKANISWLLGILVLLGGVIALWDRVGWITIPAYAQDHAQGTVEEELHKHEATNTKILSLLEEVKVTQETIIKDQQKNQDQWECDETDEELEELINKEETEGLTASQRRNKTKLEEVWRVLKCSRFTD